MARSNRGRKSNSVGALLAILLVIGVVVSLFTGKSSDKTTSKLVNTPIQSTNTQTQVAANDKNAIEVISATMRHHNIEEGGKFIDICFNRALRGFSDDNYFLKLNFSTYDQCGVENCNEMIKMRVGSLDKGKSCVRYNVFLSKPRKSGRDTYEGKKAIDFIENKLVKGNIKSLEISVYKRILEPYAPKESDLVDKKIFNNL